MSIHSVYIPDRGNFPVELIKGNDYRFVREPSVDELTQELSKDGQRAVLRCELFYLLHDALGHLFQTPDRFPPNVLDSINEMASPEAYYRSSVEWLHASGNMVSLYSWRDLGFPVTWGELAYLLFYVVKLPRRSNWVELSQGIPSNIGTSIYKLKSNGQEIISPRLADYRGTSFYSFDLWLDSMRTYGSYIPIVMYLSTADLLQGYLGITDPVVDYIFREVSAEDYQQIGLRWN